MVKPRASQTRANRTRTQVSAGSEDSGYWAASHTLHRLRFHIVWTPKYRRRVLEGPVAARLTLLLHQACEVKEWGLHELSVQADHVHLLLQVSPSDSLMNVMQILKGGTSRMQILKGGTSRMQILKGGTSRMQILKGGTSRMQILKGGTSRVLRKEFPELEEFLWGESFWGDGYFAESVGQKEEAVLRAYIRNQGKERSGSRPSSKSKPARP